MYFEQYTRGKAQQLVNSCIHYGPSVAYKAVQLLIANTAMNTALLMRMLEKYKKARYIDDKEALSDLSLIMLEAHHYFDNVSLNNQLNTSTEIIAIVRKLPL